MKPLQISADTAIKLSKMLGVPIEQLMHMPQHILLAKMSQLSKMDTDTNTPAETDHSPAELDKREES